MLELHGVSQVYEGKEILRKITYSFALGKIYGIIGPNGAGKSTLLRILTGIEKPSSGQVYWEGRLLRQPSREITCLWQQPYLFSGTVRDNILYGLRIRGWSQEEQEARLKHILTCFQLENLSGRKAAALSGGETARVALARSTAPKPRLLVLDEPAASLDPAYTAQLEEALRFIVSEEKISIILVTHDMFQAKRVAGETLYFNQGRLVEAGPTFQLFASPASESTAKFIRGELL